MRTLAIHYCLKSPGGNYDAIAEYLKGFSSWAHVHESLWFINSNKAVSEVRDELNHMVQTGDRVIVLDVTGDAWGTNFRDEITDWMHKHMGTVSLAA
jgi:23S rRNA pseudoU1915 N3-methylase RlmH